MTDLKTVTAIVKNILENNVQARNSDSLLYLKVLEHYAHENKIELRMLSVPVFLSEMSERGFPPFESVRRTRQKVQQHHPELAANDRVKGYRSQNEEVYIDFAREC